MRSGAVTLASPDDADALQRAISEAVDKRRAYGYGDAARKIARILKQELDARKGLKKPAPKRPKYSSHLVEYD